MSEKRKVYLFKDWDKAKLYLLDCISAEISRCKVCGAAMSKGWRCFNCGYDNSFNKKETEEFRKNLEFISEDDYVSFDVE